MTKINKCILVKVDQDTFHAIGSNGGRVIAFPDGRGDMDIIEFENAEVMRDVADFMLENYESEATND